MDTVGILNDGEVEWIKKNQDRCVIITDENERNNLMWGTNSMCNHLLIFHNKNGNCTVDNCAC